MPLFLSEQSLESARGESGEGGIGEDEVDKLNQELKDMRDSLAEKSKKLTERTEGAAKYDGFSLWVKIICRTYRVFSLTWPASMQIYGNKRKRLHKKRVQLPQDWLRTPIWPPFYCCGTPIWPP